MIDVIAWHGPNIGPTPDRHTYAQTRIFQKQVQEVRELAAANGFVGELHANEWGAAAPYPAPPGQVPPYWMSEPIKAKYTARFALLYCSLGIMCSWCEPWNEQETQNPSLFRDTFSADPMSPVQPQAAYYVLRTLCTVMDGATPADLPVEFGDKKTRYFSAGFATSKGDRLLAVWNNDLAADHCADARTDIILPGLQCQNAVGYDVLNGIETPLLVAQAGEQTVLKGMLIKDWPIVIRLS